MASRYEESDRYSFQKPWKYVKTLTQPRAAAAARPPRISISKPLLKQACTFRWGSLASRRTFAQPNENNTVAVIMMLSVKAVETGAKR